MSESDLLEELRVQILSVQAGDIVVFVGPEDMNAAHADRVRQQIEEHVLPEGVKAVITSGVTVDSVIRPEVPA